MLIEFVAIKLLLISPLMFAAFILFMFITFLIFNLTSQLGVGAITIGIHVHDQCDQGGLHPYPSGGAACTGPVL